MSDVASIFGIWIARVICIVLNESNYWFRIQLINNFDPHITLWTLIYIYCHYWLRRIKSVNKKFFSRALFGNKSRDLSEKSLYLPRHGLSRRIKWMQFVCSCRQYFRGGARYRGGWKVGRRHRVGVRCAWAREIREIMAARIRAPLVHTRPHSPRETDRWTVPMGPGHHSGGNSFDNNHLLFLNGLDAVGRRLVHRIGRNKENNNSQQ